MRDDRDVEWLADPGAQARLDEIRREREAQGGGVRAQVRLSVCEACGRRGLVTADRATCVVETFITEGPKDARRVVGVRGTRPERCKRTEGKRAA